MDVTISDDNDKSSVYKVLTDWAKLNNKYLSIKDVDIDNSGKSSHDISGLTITFRYDYFFKPCCSRTGKPKRLCW